MLQRPLPGENRGAETSAVSPGSGTPALSSADEHEDGEISVMGDQADAASQAADIPANGLAESRL